MENRAESKALQAIGLLASRRWPYFATSFVKMIPVRSPGLGTFACDEFWRWYYDPALLPGVLPSPTNEVGVGALLREWTVPQAATVKGHELEHLLGCHHRRRKTLGALFDSEGNRLSDAEQQKCWVEGAEKAINGQYLQERKDGERVPKWPMPGKPVLPREDEPLGKTAEWYAREAAKRIVTEQEEDGLSSRPPQGEDEGCPPGKEGGEGEGGGQEQEEEQKAPGTGGDCGSCSDGKARDYELPPPGTMMEEEQEDGSIEMVPAPGVDHEDAEVIRTHAAREVERHIATHGRGSVPAHLREWAEERLKKATVPWDKELRTRIQRSVAKAKGQQDYSYARPGRRQGIMPSVIFPSMVKPEPTVCVVGDTSGSMYGLLESLASEVNGICKSVGLSRVVFIGCGAGIHMTERISSGGGLGLAARGGTDMRVGIEAAEKLRPRPNICIVLTDGLTPWPSKAPSRMQVIVGVIGDSRTCVDRVPKWARAIHIPEDRIIKE